MEGARARTEFIQQLAYLNEGNGGNSRQACLSSTRFRTSLLGSMASPERQLALAVLERAMADLHSYRNARRGRGRRWYLDACRWVASDEREWVYSFVNICELLKLSPGALRTQLLDGSRPRPLAAAA